MNSLREFVKLLSGNTRFWARQAITALAPISGIMLFTSPSFLVRLVSGIVLMATAPVAASWFVVNSLVDPVIFSWRYRKTVPIEDEDFDALVKLSGPKASNCKLRLVPGLDNAYTNRIGRNVNFGGKLYERQNRLDRMVTMAHEIGHRVRPVLDRGSLLILADTIGIMAVLSLMIPNTAMIQILGICVLSLAMIPLRWNSEYAADDYACEVYGPRTVIPALENLVQAEKRTINSDTHPSIDRRIRRIKRKWKTSQIR